MWFYGVTVSTLDFESSNPSSNLGRTFFLIFLKFYIHSGITAVTAVECGLWILILKL